MFEKEAEEYFRENAYNFDEVTACRECMEFGYNKANEWHYVSKGEYPTEYKDILICFLTEDDMKDCVRGWYEYDFENEKHIFKYLNVLGTQYLETVIAWKEIVLPELPKEIKEK
jgi:hypothetical protein